MNEETMRMKLTYWAGIIKEARTSGMKISDWCDKNQISHRQYYYWHGKVIHSAYAMAAENKLLPEKTNVPEQALPSVPDFAELPVPRIDPEPKHDACTAPTISIPSSTRRGTIRDCLRMSSPKPSGRSALTSFASGNGGRVVVVLVSSITSSEGSSGTSRGNEHLYPPLLDSHQRSSARSVHRPA